jgi:hypothetical protein
MAVVEPQAYGRGVLAIGTNTFLLERHPANVTPVRIRRLHQSTKHVGQAAVSARLVLNENDGHPTL